MQTVFDSLEVIGRVSLPALWIPLLAWTALALPVYLVFRFRFRIHPAVQYAMHCALLMALPLSFVLMPFVPEMASALVNPTLGSFASLKSGELLVGLPASSPSGVPANMPLSFMQLLGILTVTGLALTTLQLGCAVRQARALFVLRRALRPIHERSVLLKSAELAGVLGIRRKVTLYRGPAGSIPLTFGHLRPAIVIPSDVSADHDVLNVVLEHELRHVVRGDFILGCVEQLVGCLFAIHPLVVLLRGRIRDLRELCCDADILSGGEITASRYARVLVHFAGGTTWPILARLPIINPKSSLSARITAMKRLSDMKTSSRVRNVSWTAGVAALVLPAMLAACSAGITDNKLSTAEVEDVQLEAKSLMDFKRLEVQVEYLTEELDLLRAQLEQGMSSGENLEMKPEFRRFHLLQSLYMERLGLYETMKLEAETDRRLQAAGLETGTS